MGRRGAGGVRRAGQFLIQVESPGEADAAQVERLIRDQLQALAADGPTPEELERSRHRLEAAWRWEQEDLGGLASGLGHVALWEDWRAWQAEHRAALAVTADQIKTVAGRYFREERLTVGWATSRAGVVVPTTPAEPMAVRVPRPSTPRAAERAIGLVIPDGGTHLNDFHPWRGRLDNGLRLITERRPGTGIVALELFVDAGLLREAKPGVAYLTGRLLEEGTPTRSAERSRKRSKTSAGRSNSVRPARRCACEPRISPGLGNPRRRHPPPQFTGRRRGMGTPTDIIGTHC